MKRGRSESGQEKRRLSPKVKSPSIYASPIFNERLCDHFAVGVQAKLGFRGSSLSSGTKGAGDCRNIARGRVVPTVRRSNWGAPGRTRAWRSESLFSSSLDAGFLHRQSLQYIITISCLWKTVGVRITPPHHKINRLKCTVAQCFFLLQVESTPPPVESQVSLFLLVLVHQVKLED